MKIKKETIGALVVAFLLGLVAAVLTDASQHENVVEFLTGFACLAAVIAFITTFDDII